MNLALPPYGSEQELLQAIGEGTCAVGVVSSLAFARFNNPTLAAGWPYPAYIDLEAVGIGRHARSPDAARRFVEWFIAHEAQAAHTAGSGLLPANAAVLAEQYEGMFNDYTRNAGVAGVYEVDAVKLAERASYR